MKFLNWNPAASRLLDFIDISERFAALYYLIGVSPGKSWIWIIVLIIGIC
jgi:hypothetical protein